MTHVDLMKMCDDMYTGRTLLVSFVAFTPTSPTTITAKLQQIRYNKKYNTYNDNNYKYNYNTYNVNNYKFNTKTTTAPKKH